MAKAKPKYSAAAFRGLLAKLAAAKAEARPAIEEQIKEVVELASPGFGARFIDLFRKQWSSRQDAIEYRNQRNLIRVWLDEFTAARRKPYAEKARRDKADSKAERNRQMVTEFSSPQRVRPRYCFEDRHWGAPRIKTKRCYRGNRPRA